MNQIKGSVILKSGKEQSIKRFHPWVFSGAIKKKIGECNDGDLVRVVSNKDEFLALGHFNNGSIAIRVISFTEVPINDDFWIGKIQDAYNYRQQLQVESEHTNVYRLVGAEGDELPGLIIDYYNGTAVLQMHCVGMYRNRETICNALKVVLGDKLNAVYDKSESTLPRKKGLDAKNGYLIQGKSQNFAVENGNKYKVNWVEGQKTGFFIDQRDNRKLLGELSNNKKVLNVFGYTGGFSVSAMQGNASLVHTVDSSAKAIELTNENIALNFEDTSRHEAYAVDAFAFLREMKEDYDIIILDPPAFAKHKDVLSNALKGYKRLNQIGFEKIKKGGIIFTFSCSQVVSKDNFRKAVFVAAATAGRKVKIIHQLTQPVDHPVNLYHPEGEYLKGLVLYVE